MSRNLCRQRKAITREWREGLHVSLDRPGQPSASARCSQPAGHVVDHCGDAMAAVRVQAGTTGSDDDLTVDIRILLRWGAFDVGLSCPDDPDGEWVLRLGARDTASGEVDVLAAALRAAADLIEAAAGGGNEAQVSALQSR